jgi:DNA-binding MarR family transcriptional regulator
MSKELRTLANAISAFRDLDQEIQAQTMLTFLCVAESPDPIGMRDLQTRLGVASSSTSRNVAALSKHQRVGKAGHDLVEAFEDPADRRSKRVRLTAKGRTFAARLGDLIR